MYNGNLQVVDPVPEINRYLTSLLLKMLVIVTIYFDETTLRCCTGITTVTCWKNNRLLQTSKTILLKR